VKQCSQALNDLLLDYIHGKRTTWYIAELYTFWLKMDLSYNSGYFNSGTILLYTGHDTDLTIGGNKYSHFTIQHGDINEKRGVETTNTDLTINYNPNDKIPELGTTWFNALQGGAFDGAYLSIDRLFSPIPWQYNMPNISSDFVLKGRFFGRCDIQEVKLTQATIDVKSPTDLLNAQLPRNLIKPSCLNRFCDTMCGLNKKDFAYEIVASSDSSKNSIAIFGDNENYPDGFFDQGTMICTYGDNIGVTRSIKTFKDNKAIPAEPFKIQVSEGDRFTFWKGCAKTMTACEAYKNINNFRGFPFLPCKNVLL
jgi:uncharacterized phage protein (TIGR02218 family)